MKGLSPPFLLNISIGVTVIVSMLTFHRTEDIQLQLNIHSRTAQLSTLVSTKINENYGFLNKTRNLKMI